LGQVKDLLPNASPLVSKRSFQENTSVSSRKHRQWESTLIRP
jgi:hypothetical protein